MLFTQYETAEAFSADALELLKKHEIQNNLLFLNIGDGKLMLTVKDDQDRVLLTAVRTPPHPMVMYETDNLHSEQAVAFFARSLHERGIDVEFLMANSELAQSFIRRYAEHTGKQYKKEQRLALSIADRVMEPKAVAPGSLRLATEDDLYFLPYWCAAFTEDCALGPHDLEAGLNTAKRAIADKRLYIWEDGGPVSIAGTPREVTGCSFIGYVYTPPYLRGRGYATACVYRLTRRLMETARPRCALYVDCANPVSNSIYEKLGYRRTGYVEQYREIQAGP